MTVTHFVGNHPALDFLNTAPVEAGVVVDRLVDYAALLVWLERAELLSADDARAARTRWGNAKDGKQVLEHAHALRSALHDVVDRIAHGSEPSNAARSRLNAELRHQTGIYTELVSEGGAIVSRRRLFMTTALDVLAPLYEAVGDLFSSVDLGLVRKCEDADCVLFFYDTTKNHGRRWCTMETCGNRNKVKAYRARAGRN